MKTFHIRFYEDRKIFFAISLSIIAIGIIFNFIFGADLDINFKGGALVTYSYSGDVNSGDVENIVQDASGRNVSVQISKDMTSSDNAANLATISFSGTGTLSLDTQQAITAALNAKYPDAAFTVKETNSVDATMGASFFIKCLVAVIITFILLDLYIALRFRKIGGMAAGMFAIVALLHDVAMVYFTFIIFRISIDANFIAVVLTILGYSLNDTIVIYDRIRENRRLFGPKTGADVLVNTSINQTFTRSVYTALCVVMSIATVLVIGLIYNLSSVTTFALPMMIGVVSGAYSSICIAGPLYVMWEKHKQKVRATSLPQKAAAQPERFSADTHEELPEAEEKDLSARKSAAGTQNAAKKPTAKKKSKKRKR